MMATCGRTPNAKRCDTMATAVFARSERAAPFWFFGPRQTGDAAGQSPLPSAKRPSSRTLRPPTHGLDRGWTIFGSGDCPKEGKGSPSQKSRNEVADSP